MHAEKTKCPYCGKTFTIPLRKLEDEEIICDCGRLIFLADRKLWWRPHQEPKQPQLGFIMN